mgnify:CR=1 FL=1
MFEQVVVVVVVLGRRRESSLRSIAEEIGMRKLDWIGLDWTGLDWIGMDWIGLGLGYYFWVVLLLFAFPLSVSVSPAFLRGCVVVVLVGRHSSISPKLVGPLADKDQDKEDGEYLIETNC